MIHPLTRFPIKRSLWYQGESNGGEGDPYVQKMRAMIETWRKRWDCDFPFYFVQLPNWGEPSNDPGGGGHDWQYCRMAQLKCLGIPGTGMAVTIDVGEAGDLHPKNKLDVGERLALWALAGEYGRAGLVHSGPLYKTMVVEGSRIRVSFDSVGGGLMVGRKAGRHQPSRTRVLPSSGSPSPAPTASGSGPMPPSTAAQSSCPVRGCPGPLPCAMPSA